MPEAVSASLEDYLEAIFHIVAQKHAARPKDISKRLNVNNSSVTGALKLLSEKGLVNYAPYDLVTLTGKGQELAKDVVRRHESLRDFFEKVLAIDPSAAEEAACRMEHAVPREIVERFIAFTEFVETCPRGGSKWIAGFGYHCNTGEGHANCERCITQCLEEVRKKEHRGKAAKMRVALSELEPGQKGTVSRVKTRGPALKRIAEMGVMRGVLVEVERVAPLGDPIEIKVRGYHLSLRKEEAAKIEIQTI